MWVGLGLLVAAEARAADTVVMLRSPGGASWRAVEERTRDELRLMGIRVVEARARTVDIQRIIAEQGAQAVIRSARGEDGGSVEIWFGDGREPQRVALHGGALVGGEAATLAALRTAEVVHAGIVGAVPAVPEVAGVDGRVAEVGLPAVEVPVIDVTAVPVVRPAIVSSVEAPVPRAPPRVLADEELLAARVPPPRSVPVATRRVRSVAVSVAGLGGPGGVGGLAELALAVGLRLTPRLSLAPAVSAAVTPVAMAGPTGSIRVGWAAGQMLLGYAPGRLGARVSPRLGGGGGLAVVWAQGRASSPLQGGTDVTPVGMVSGAAGLAIRVHARLRLVVGAGVSVLLPAVAVRVSGEEVARLGPLVVRGVLGLEWGPRGGE